MSEFEGIFDIFGDTLTPLSSIAPNTTTQPQNEQMDDSNSDSGDDDLAPPTSTSELTKIPSPSPIEPLKHTRFPPELIEHFRSTVIPFLTPDFTLQNGIELFSPLRPHHSTFNRACNTPSFPLADVQVILIMTQLLTIDPARFVDSMLNMNNATSAIYDTYDAISPLLPQIRHNIESHLPPIYHDNNLKPYTSQLSAPTSLNYKSKHTSMEKDLLYNLLHNDGLDDPMDIDDLWFPTQKQQNTINTSVTTQKSLLKKKLLNEWQFSATLGQQVNNPTAQQWFQQDPECVFNITVQNNILTYQYNLQLEALRSVHTLPTAKLAQKICYNHFTIDTTPTHVRDLTLNCFTSDRGAAGSLFSSMVYPPPQPPSLNSIDLTAEDDFNNNINPAEPLNPSFLKPNYDYMLSTTIQLPWPAVNRFKIRYGGCYNCGANHNSRDCPHPSNQARQQRNGAQQRASQNIILNEGTQVNVATGKWEKAGGSNVDISTFMPNTNVRGGQINPQNQQNMGYGNKRQSYGGTSGNQGNYSDNINTNYNINRERDRSYQNNPNTLNQSNYTPNQNQANYNTNPGNYNNSNNNRRSYPQQNPQFHNSSLQPQFNPPPQSFRGGMSIQPPIPPMPPMPPQMPQIPPMYQPQQQQYPNFQPPPPPGF